MKKIRRGVFETNSSSSHSITIGKYSICTLSQLPSDLNYEDKIEIHLDEFCNEPKYSQESRVAWLIQLIVNCEMEDSWNGFWYTSSNAEWEALAERLYEMDSFKQLSDEIASYTDTKGIVLAPYTEGYIDHESCECYGSMQDFLDQHGTDICSFVFGSDVVMFFEFNG